MRGVNQIPLVFGHSPTNLQQQLIMRVLTHGRSTNSTWLPPFSSSESHDPFDGYMYGLVGQERARA